MQLETSVCVFQGSKSADTAIISLDLVHPHMQFTHTHTQQLWEVFILYTYRTHTGSSHNTRTGKYTEWSVGLTNELW